MEKESTLALSFATSRFDMRVKALSITVRDLVKDYLDDDEGCS